MSARPISAPSRGSYPRVTTVHQVHPRESGALRSDRESAMTHLALLAALLLFGQLPPVMAKKLVVALARRRMLGRGMATSIMVRLELVHR